MLLSRRREKETSFISKNMYSARGPETFEITFSPHAKTALEIKRRAGSFLSQSARESFRAVNGKTISQLFAKLFKALARLCSLSPCRKRIKLNIVFSPLSMQFS